MKKDYNRWNKIKQKINQRGYRKIKVGEIWWCALGLTTKGKIGHWYLKITYSNKVNSKVILNQAKPIDVKRLVKKLEKYQKNNTITY